MFDKDGNALAAINEHGLIALYPKMINRHGLITGATGTGKTVTLQTLAETFSQMGVPVFAADVKGDLSGVAAPGGNKDSVVKRVEQYGLAGKGFAFQGFPVQFWDVFGEQGVPVRAEIGAMGPLLLSRLLSLNDTQSAVLGVVFKMAKDESLDLVDIKDLRKILEYASKNSQVLSSRYGNIAPASVGAIQRGLVALEQQGADRFFGEPALQAGDLLMNTPDGKGVINILAADKLMQAPAVYTSFLLWLLNTLFTTLPEVGDRDKPGLVFFFDEAHLLFRNTSKALLEQVEQVVRLIRSKGVGIFFISQTPSDIPDTVLSQLGNRVQHALRAYTPNDLKAVKAAAGSFRANPAFDTETVITELGIGEALVSFLDGSGTPQPVERAFILPPQGQIGPLEGSAREAMTEKSPLYRIYATAQDRSSAYEKLSERMAATPDEKELKARARDEERQRKEAEKAAREAEKARLAAEKEQQRQAEKQQRFWGGVAKSVLAPVARKFITSLFKK